MRCTKLILAACFFTTAASAAEFDLPDQVTWTAFGTGAAGYSQAVAIGAALKEAADVNLRVLPGQNDIARLEPVRQRRVEFSANGVGVYLAQEGVMEFGEKNWGPQKIRLLATNFGGGAGVNIGVAREACEEVGKPDCEGFTHADLEGMRVTWVRGGPALNLNAETWLAYGGLTWDDVEKVEVGGYAASWNAVIDGSADAALAATNSGPAYEAASSPRGLYWPPIDPADDEAWERAMEVGPYYVKGQATAGANLDGTEGKPMGLVPYPALMTYADQDPDLVYNMTKAMFDTFPLYKDEAPGINGWDLEHQRFDWVVPYHEAAVRYYEEAGVWTEEAQAHNERLIARQEALVSAWEELEAEDPENWEEAWAQKRREALEEGGFNVVL